MSYFSGLADQRTIVVVLATLVLGDAAGVLDLSRHQAGPQLLLDLMLLAGFLYGARTLLRLPYHLWLAMGEWRDVYGKCREGYTSRRERPSPRGPGFYYWIWSRPADDGEPEPVQRLTAAARALRILGAAALDPRYWEPESPYSGDRFRKGPRATAARVADRVALIGLTALAAWPPAYDLASVCGAIGLVVLLVVYAARGNFELLLTDPTAKADAHEYDRLRHAAPSMPSFPSSIATYPASRD